MPGVKQTWTQVTLQDYIYDVAGNPIANARVTVTPNWNALQLSSPSLWLAPVQLRTTTDSTGYWSVTLTNNSSTSDATSTYTVATPYNTFQVAIPAGAGPFTASANKASTSE